MTAKDEQEWLYQAGSDMSAAETLFQGRKYIYAVFMCHLAVEKALKAACLRRTHKDPPRTHDLVYLSNLCAAELPAHLASFVESLSSISVHARYPEDLRAMAKDYDKQSTGECLRNGKEVIKWLKARP